MRIKQFSKKQGRIFRFIEQPESALICDGAVRSGKTVSMTLAFIMWAMSHFDRTNFAICGKTVQSAERNILIPFQTIEGLPYHLDYKTSKRILIARCGDTENYFYLFGGKDERSYSLIQGITLAGVLFDEVALMPRSFVDQAIARTLTYPDKKLWFNCNPDSPSHWFYQEWILHPEAHNAVHLHFLMQDNPVMTQETIQAAESMFSGVFYDRYILGKWVVAEGLIYPDQANGQGIVESNPRDYVSYYVSCDYGTLNPCSMGLWGLYKGVWYRFAEYYHDGREHGQRTDEEHYAAMEQLVGNRKINAVVIDPSAASFITCIRKHGKYLVRPARNDVLDGIRRTAAAFHDGKIKICDCCSGALTEFKSYRWDDKKPEDKPIKENDHAMDDIRYFVNTILQGPVFDFT